MDETCQRLGKNLRRAGSMEKISEAILLHFSKDEVKELLKLLEEKPGKAPPKK